MRAVEGYNGPKSKSNPSQIQPKSSQIQPKTKPNQIQIQIKSKSRQKSLGSPRKSIEQILGNPYQNYKSQDLRSSDLSWLQGGILGCHCHCLLSQAGAERSGARLALLGSLGFLLPRNSFFTILRFQDFYDLYDFYQDSGIQLDSTWDFYSSYLIWI